MISKGELAAFPRKQAADLGTDESGSSEDQCALFFFSGAHTKMRLKKHVFPAPSVPWKAGIQQLIFPQSMGTRGGNLESWAPALKDPFGMAGRGRLVFYIQFYLRLFVFNANFQLGILQPPIHHNRHPIHITIPIRNE